MKPDSKLHNPDPKHLRSLIEGARISQRKAAEIVGLSPRTIRAYLAGDRPIPYSVQFVMESYFKHILHVSTFSLTGTDVVVTFEKYPDDSQTKPDYDHVWSGNYDDTRFADMKRSNDK